MKMQDVHRYQSEQLNDLEEEERRKNEELRQKAFEQVQEQEDEIKRLNEVSFVQPANWRHRALRHSGVAKSSTSFAGVKAGISALLGGR